ncbi:glycosyltransferase family 2 protein [Agreia pratensis]|nr:glycosyltransferase family 2 protein [Agreia pratensis]
MTLMVRDEADIVGAMLDHHIDQGIDFFIVTDNGSVDGTTDILRDYESRGILELRHDPEHRKQQSRVVSRMASDAYTLYNADWVINADADEFFVPVDRSRTLHDVFREMPRSYGAFQVPVVNLTGPPANAGSGLQRLVYRDQRPIQALELVGLRAHASPDAIHVGTENVVVAQGNHEVNVASMGSPSAELAVEVLHLPWRSWTQFANKVEISGRAYESSPDATPSPNHHGMRDYARFRANTLLPFYIRRHPSAREIDEGLENGTFVLEEFISSSRPSPVPDQDFDVDILRSAVPVVEALEDLQHVYLRLLHDAERASRLEAEQAFARKLHEESTIRDDRIAALEASLERTLAHVEHVEAELASVRNSFEVRLGSRLRRLTRR